MEELTTLKNWINIRLQWLDDNIPSKCYIDYTAILTKSILTKSSSNLNVFSTLGSNQLNVSGTIDNPFNSELKVYDIQGRLLHTFILNTGKINQAFTISEKGILLYKIENKNGIIQQGKIIIN